MELLFAARESSFQKTTTNRNQELWSSVPNEPSTKQHLYPRLKKHPEIGAERVQEPEEQGLL